MEINEIAKDQIIEVLKEQMKSNTPPEVKTTYNRLRKEGCDDFETKQVLGQCLTVGIFQVLKFSKPYNNARYVKNLKALSKEPIK